MGQLISECDLYNGYTQNEIVLFSSNKNTLGTSSVTVTWNSLTAVLYSFKAGEFLKAMK